MFPLLARLCSQLKPYRWFPPLDCGQLQFSRFPVSAQPLTTKASALGGQQNSAIFSWGVNFRAERNWGIEWNRKGKDTPVSALSKLPVRPRLSCRSCSHGQDSWISLLSFLIHLMPYKNLQIPREIKTSNWETKKRKYDFKIGPCPGGGWSVEVS